MGKTTLLQERAIAAMKSLFVADALAMPVHWYYNPLDIEQAFPGGIRKLEAAPSFHPSSIMSLHSTARGGRGTQATGVSQREIVGEVILKGKRQFWGQPNQHYHQQMQAGENTLNAHCARVLMRTMWACDRHYDKDRFLDAYIAFMMADPPLHRDTYAESYHRGFFANLESGKPKDLCGAVTHDTASIGALVTIAPLVLAERVQGAPFEAVQTLARTHLFLTHPDQELARICVAYVELLDGLLFRTQNQSPEDLLVKAAQASMGLNLLSLTAKQRPDRDVVGGLFSPACYISDSWPSVLYLAYKYLEEPKQALLANTNLGGDNVHRGAVLGTLLGLIHAATLDEFFDALMDRNEIAAEISRLLVQPGD
ncbi:MAG: ADP-ribosylglycohydrolase family protein [Phycisphaerae bacterium]|nr:ADP-ribosylglycohydrolase family protein [Phycisphaerae bacterium]